MTYRALEADDLSSLSGLGEALRDPATQIHNLNTPTHYTHTHTYPEIWHLKWRLHHHHYTMDNSQVLVLADRKILTSSLCWRRRGQQLAMLGALRSSPSCKSFHLPAALLCDPLLPHTPPLYTDGG